MNKASGISAGQALAVHTEVVDTQALRLRKQLSGRAVSRSRSRVLGSAPQDRGRPGGGEGEEQGRSSARTGKRTTANVGLPGGREASFPGEVAASRVEGRGRGESGRCKSVRSSLRGWAGSAEARCLLGTSLVFSSSAAWAGKVGLCRAVGSAGGGGRRGGLWEPMEPVSRQERRAAQTRPPCLCWARPFVGDEGRPSPSPFASPSAARAHSPPPGPCATFSLPPGAI